MTTHTYSTSPRAIIASHNQKISQNKAVQPLTVDLADQSIIKELNGKRPLGLDLATKKYRLCYQDDLGKMINVELRKNELRKMLRETPGKYHLCIEGCSGASYWERFARENGHKVKVVPGYVTRKLGWNQPKDDFNDAYNLYNALFNPLVPSCQTRTEDELAISALISQKEALLKSLNEQVNKTRSFLIETGEYDCVVKGGGSAVQAIELYISNHVHAASEHKRSIRCLEGFKRMILSLTREIDEINETLSEYGQTNKQVKLLLTIPGVGIETAVPIAIGAKNIERFESARQFQAYWGYHPTHGGSGGEIEMGKMSSNGDRALKRTLYESALSLNHQGRYKDEPRSEWIYTKVTQNKAAFKKGMIVIGAKILRTAYGVLKTGKPYNPAIDNSLGRIKTKIHKRSNPKYKEQNINAVLQNKYEQELTLAALG